MFRTLHKISDNPVLTDGFLQLVRWRRKPRWLPVAKSKLFRVPERKFPENPAEKAELMCLHANYKTQLRAVRGFLMKETIEREATSTADHVIISPEEMEEEFRQCSQLNNKWNAEIAIIRTKRLKAEWDVQQELIKERLAANSERAMARLKQSNELVQLEKERASKLITSDNIDEAIETALAEAKCYNYAIDSNGQKLVSKIE